MMYQIQAISEVPPVRLGMIWINGMPLVVVLISGLSVAMTVVSTSGVTLH